MIHRVAHFEGPSGWRRRLRSIFKRSDRDPIALYQNHRPIRSKALCELRSTPEPEPLSRPDVASKLTAEGSVTSSADFVP